MNRRTATLVVLLTLLTPALPRVAAQAFDFEDEGPYQVYFLDSFVPSGAVSQNTPAVFSGLPVSGFVGYRIYWPGPPNPFVQTPFVVPQTSYRPLVMFLHGWGSNPAAYHAMCTHLASWGFVVPAVFYNINPIQNQLPIEQAYEAWILHEYLLAEAAAPGSANPVNGLIDPNPATPYRAVGHSMGGAAAIYLAGADPRLETIVAVEPYEESEIGSFGTCTPTALFNGTAAAIPIAQNYTGSAFLLEGNDDTLVNGSVDKWYQYFNQGPVLPRRLVKLSVDGVGHFGSADVGLTLNPNPILPCGVPYTDDMALMDQHRIHRRFITTCLLAEYDPFTVENRFLDLFGDGIRDEDIHSNASGGQVPIGFQVEGNCPDTIIWAEERAFPWDGSCGQLGQPIRGNSVSYGLIGQPGDQDLLALLVPTVLFGGACPTGFGYLNYCIFEAYNFIGVPGASIGGSGMRECNLPILAGGIQVELVSYLYRGGPYDLTRFVPLVVAP